VTRAVEYLDRLASESAGDASLQRELAGAYAKMGDAQGNPYLANLGDRAGAMSSYRKAFELHAAIAAAFPADPAAQRDVAADHIRIADMLWADARYVDALPRYRESMAIYQRLALEDTRRLDDRFNVTRSLNRMGQLQMNAGDLPAALKLYQQSKALTADLSAVAPDNVAYRRGFAVAALKSATLPIGSTTLPPPSTATSKRSASRASCRSRTRPAPICVARSRSRSAAWRSAISRFSAPAMP
jgi:tetratricopeptide (TPR) repeat protein